MKFTHLKSEEEVRELVQWHNLHSEFVVIDCETDSVDPRKARLIDIQMSGREEDSAVLFDGKYLLALKELTATQVYHNFKYDWKVMLKHGLDMRGKPMRDGMLLHHLMDENADHDLDSLVQEWYGDNYKQTFWADFDSYPEAPFERRLDYACKDIVYTGLAYRRIRDQLRADGIPVSLDDHVHRLALALLDTEIEGIRVDLPYTIQMGTELKSDIVTCEAELRRLGGWQCELIEMEQWRKEIEKYKTDKKRASVPKPEFNFNASGQVCTLLYDKLRLPVQINKKTKSRTADDKALEKLGDAHPILPEIRKLRKLSKMYGTFVEGILEKAEADRIYPNFNVNGTDTGRISHSEPNMGQMPSKGDWVKIRGIFVPDAGTVLGTADYGQLEVWIAAHYSRDANLLKIILEGASQHDITAAGMGVPRAVAKTINFSMQYGATKYKIRDILNCSDAEAEFALNKYWETYSGLKKFIDWTHAEMRAGRPIVNPFGRLRRFPKKFENKWDLAKAERQVFSSLIQGTGGDMMSAAYYSTHEELKTRKLGRGWFTIHDEGLLQCLPERFEEAMSILVGNMHAVAKRISPDLPIKVEPSDALSRWEK